jgi:threonine dehydrogenase-like Zn-dependent dehydrogenase
MRVNAIRNINHQTILVGDVVGVWGCGPIGLMAASWAKDRGASRVIAIDNVPSRLKLAQEIGAETINFKEVKDTLGKIRELAPKGLDVGIDAVGFRYASKSMRHKVEKMLYAETDSVDVVDEVIKSVKKGGRVVLIGDYIGVANHFPIGALMEKSLTLRGGQLHPQKYWPILLPKLLSSKVPVDLFTHRMSLTDTPRAYKVFDAKDDGVLKIVLTTKEADKITETGSHVDKSHPIEETIVASTIVE